LTIKLPTTGSGSLNSYIYNQGGKYYLNLEIKVHIKAYTNINLRFKVIHKWESSQGVTQKDIDLLNYEYENDFDTIPDGEFVYYNQMVEKSEDFVTIPVLKRIELNANTFPTGYNFLKIAIITTAVQNNRYSAVWDNGESTLFKEEVTFTSNFNLNNFIVDYDNLTTHNETLKNLVFKFKHYNNNGNFTDSKGKHDIYYYVKCDGVACDNLTLPSGNYEVIIYSVNLVDLQLNSLTNPTKLTILLSTGYDNWGYEDYLYAPNILKIWAGGRGYNSGEIVYYDGPEELKGFYISVYGGNWSEPPGGSWKKYSAAFTSGATYSVGDVVYYDGQFWRAKNNGLTSPPEINHWGWEPFGLYFAIGSNKYKLGDFVYSIDSNGQKEWYFASAKSTNYSQLEDWTGWKKATSEYNAFNGQAKYERGEIVTSNGAYYIVQSNYIWGPALNNSSHFTASVERGEYNSQTSYSKANIVTITSEDETVRKFMWTKDTNAVNIDPLLGRNGWRELTDQWRPNNEYLNTGYIKERVIFNNKTYYWNGTSNSNSESAPGAERNGWIEITDMFAPFNTYVQGDFVVHDGSLWEALEDVPHNPVTGANIIPRSIGSYGIWKEYPIIWDPGRN
ncbi:MAG: hypothetical protein GX149_04415, partial [Acholeplasmataceae bacterium]|nr:hypothetical protein [Acholeplasmataceae bacterium]